MPKHGADAWSEFRIFETEEFQKKLRKLHLREARFIQQKLSDDVYPQLRPDPFWGPNIKKLKGYEPATWRYRIGRFRVFFMVDRAERIIFMLTVDDRRDAYR